MGGKGEWEGVVDTKNIMGWETVFFFWMATFWAKKFDGVENNFAGSTSIFGEVTKFFRAEK